MRVLFLSDLDAVDLLEVLWRAGADYRGLSEHFPDPAGVAGDLARSADRLFNGVNLQLGSSRSFGGEHPAATREDLTSMHPGDRATFLSAIAALYHESTRPTTFAERTP